MKWFLLFSGLGFMGLGIYMLLNAEHYADYGTPDGKWQFRRFNGSREENVWLYMGLGILSICTGVVLLFGAFLRIFRG